MHCGICKSSKKLHNFVNWLRSKVLGEDLFRNTHPKYTIPLEFDNMPTDEYDHRQN